MFCTYQKEVPREVYALLSYVHRTYVENLNRTRTFSFYIFIELDLIGCLKEAYSISTGLSHLFKADYQFRSFEPQTLQVMFQFDSHLVVFYIPVARNSS